MGDILYTTYNNNGVVLLIHTCRKDVTIASAAVRVSDVKAAEEREDGNLNNAVVISLFVVLDPWSTQNIPFLSSK